MPLAGASATHDVNPGLLAPDGTPKGVVDKVAHAVARSSQAKSVTEALCSHGARCFRALRRRQDQAMDQRDPRGQDRARLAPGFPIWDSPPPSVTNHLAETGDHSTLNVLIIGRNLPRVFG